jgi:hypothetical protein
VITRKRFRPSSMVLPLRLPSSSRSWEKLPGFYIYILQLAISPSEECAPLSRCHPRGVLIWSSVVGVGAHVNSKHSPVCKQITVKLSLARSCSASKHGRTTPKDLSKFRAHGCEGDLGLAG